MKTSTKTLVRVSAMLCALALTIPLIGEAADLKRIVVLNFGLIDDTKEPDKYEAQQKRLLQISDQLRSELEQKKLYNVVDAAPAKGLIEELKAGQELHACNGCELDIAKKLGADRVLTGWVQKVSNLILNVNIEVKNVQTGEVTLKKSVDIRGNTDDSWRHGIKYMVRDMVDKKQGGR